MFIARAVGLKEITPLGQVVNSTNDPCFGHTKGRWPHDVLLRPNNKVLFLGSKMYDASTVLPGHGMQVGDTIEEWDQVNDVTQRLFEEGGVIPFIDSTLSSDATEGFFWSGCPTEDPTAEDWTHSNSIFVGPNGNVIVSMRHINQIISIAPDFQSLNWRLGGPGGDFTFPNSGDRFYHQHSAVELADGNILLFDNGNGRPEAQGGQYSRALELELNTTTNTAIKVWEARHTPNDLAALCCSNVTRLANGNTVLVFGADFAAGTCCRVFTLLEAGAANSGVDTQWEVQISSPGKEIQYRVYPIDSIKGEGPPPS